MVEGSPLDACRGDATPPNLGSPSSSWVDRGSRAALVTFVVAVVGAGIYYLVVGRNQWFFADEWDQLVTRGLSDPDDLLRPHNDHLQALPTVLYRVLFRLFGLRSYVPYQLPVVLLFLLSAVLLRVILRRAGVGPWLATVTGMVFLLLGSAMENIVFGIQVTMMGSFAFGLAALLLVDHEPPGPRWFTRRDYWALGCGLIALLCSGVAVTMIGVIVLALWLRRGWRPAMAFGLPLAAGYLLWFVLYGTSGVRPGAVGTYVRFVGVGIEATFVELGHLPAMGFVLGFVLVVGLASCGQQAVRARRGGSGASAVIGLVRHRLAAPVALLVGGVGLLLFTGLGRAGSFGAQSAHAPRYFGLTIPMLLPALALAVDAIMRRSRVAGAVALVVLVVGVPGNISAGLDQIEARDTAIAQARALIIALPALPEAAGAPDDLRPLPESGYAPDITMAFLRRATDEGWLPAPDGIAPSVARAGALRLSIYQTWSAETPEEEGESCTDLGAVGDPGQVIHVEHGRRVRIAGGFVTVGDVAGAGAEVPTGYPTVTYNPNRGDTLEVLAGALDLRLTSGGVNGPGQLCTIS